MKRVSYSLLLIFLLSCGTTLEVLDDASVYLIDGNRVDGMLMSVKDSVVEVELNDLPTNTLTRMKLPFSQIDYILLPNNGSAWWLTGGAAGCLSGSAIGCGVGSIYKNNSSSEYPFSVFLATVGGLVGAAAGSIIAYEIDRHSNIYYLYKEKDLEYLRTVAIEK